MTDASLRERLEGRRNRDLVAGLLVFAAIAAATLVPHWSTRFAAALVVFTVWMGWFVETLASWLGDED